MVSTIVLLVVVKLEETCFGWVRCLCLMQACIGGHFLTLTTWYGLNPKSFYGHHQDAENANLHSFMTLQDVLKKHGVGGGAAENYGYDKQKDTGGGGVVSDDKAAALARLAALMAEEAKARAVLESLTAAAEEARAALVRLDV